MPELPDVEFFKEYFKDNSLHKKIINIECEDKTLIKNVDFRDFKKSLIRKSFRDAWRIGKFFIAEIKGISENLIIHFGMTGSLHYVKQGEERKRRDRFTRLCFRFANGYELRWINIRRLGKIYLTKPQNIKLIEEMGPEPLQLSQQEFLRLLTNHELKNIKAFLMDQRNIAGIGNVYSDEILFQARINPHRKIEDLTQKKKKILFQKIYQVLTEATKILTFYRAFPKSWLEPHRHLNDLVCPRNKNHKLNRETIAGRSAIFCPLCQS